MENTKKKSQKNEHRVIVNPKFSPINVLNMLKSLHWIHPLLVNWFIFPQIS